MNLAERLNWRAQRFAELRQFLSARGVLEAQIPSLFSAPGTDPDIEVPRVTDATGRHLGFLQSSPEYALKRLVADSRLDLFSLGPAFRIDEQGPRHALEFTMLEWYRVGWTLDSLIDETLALAQSQLGDGAVHKFRYKDAFESALGICPLTAADAEIQEALGRVNYQGPALSRDSALQLLCALEVEPNLPELSILHHYPPGQAALARRVIDADGQEVAARFEMFGQGVELANGYWELTDVAEQRARMLEDLDARRTRGLPEVPLDEDFLEALPRLPDCAGVALGVDRLLMLSLGADDIQFTRLF